MATRLTSQVFVKNGGNMPGWIKRRASMPLPILNTMKSHNGENTTRLQEWMHHLWAEKGKPGAVRDPHWGEMFNGIEVELGWQDIQRLQDDIERGNLANEYYKELDMKFCLDAKEQIFLFRKRVFYNSSW
jgi:hypothetical protein